MNVVALEGPRVGESLNAAERSAAEYGAAVERLTASSVGDVAAPTLACARAAAELAAESMAELAQMRDAGVL